MKDGKFFEKRAKSADGRFLRDLPGRGNAAFHKAAGLSTSDEDMVPTGIHRAAKAQPEALESGGERFHSTTAEPTDFGTGKGIDHAMVEGGKMRIGVNASSQMGKHAAPRFLGTSFEKKGGVYDDIKSSAGKASDYAGSKWDKLTANAGKGGHDIGGKLDKGVDAIVGSPAGALVALGAGGLAVKSILGRGARGVAGMFRRGGGAATKSRGLIGRGVDSIKKALS